MKTLIYDDGRVAVVGEITTKPDGHHVGGEVWPLFLRVVDGAAPGLDFRWDGVEFVAIPAEPTNLPAAVLAQLVAEIDARVAAIYSRWTRFDLEYAAREAAARAFAAEGYDGPCSVWVTSFAEPAGLPLRAATDLIIAQADSLRMALEALGALRMRKYEVTRAADAAAAEAAHAAIMARADIIEAGLQ